MVSNRDMAGNKNSGKKKGATSFVAIELSRIQELMNPNAEVVVSRKWAEALGLTGGRDLKIKQNTADSMAKPIPTEEKTMDAIDF
tara:strand:+ start:203 stop:457 length:255 start_codon:yes stop_codon:yes gene_type:complete